MIWPISQRAHSRLQNSLVHRSSSNEHFIFSFNVYSRLSCERIRQQSMDVNICFSLLPNSSARLTPFIMVSSYAMLMCNASFSERSQCISLTVDLAWTHTTKVRPSTQHFLCTGLLWIILAMNSVIMFLIGGYLPRHPNNL